MKKGRKIYRKILPDKEKAFLNIVIKTKNGIIILEVDENCHDLKNLKEKNLYNVSCEQSRMINLISSLRLAGKIEPITCFNPHSFRINAKLTDIPFDERSETILEFINYWEPKSDFKLYYYYYSEYILDDKNKTSVCLWDHKNFDAKLLECAYIV
jgi:hypothetical protein